MARDKKIVIRSDLSGELVSEDEAVTITIRFADRTRNKVELDAAESEVAEMIKGGREVRRRAQRSRTRTRPVDDQGSAGP